MKTTLDLPDELMKAIKIRAVNENRRIKDVVAEALRRGLAVSDEPGGTVRRRVRLPLIEGAHDAQPGDEMTPDRVASILEAQEAANDSARE